MRPRPWVGLREQRDAATDAFVRSQRTTGARICRVPVVTPTTLLRYKGAAVAERREIVAAMVARGVSERAACQAVGGSRSSSRYRPCGSDDAPRRGQVVERASQPKRYGYRRITALLRRQGEQVNHKRVWKIWQHHGLALPRRRPRQRKAGQRVALPTRAEHRGHGWTYDCVDDRTATNRVLTMLVVVDEDTRECHAIGVGYGLDSEAVRATLEELVERYGAPAQLRSDNGPECIAQSVKAWLRRQGTRTASIEPGQP
jgi:putative transposase